MKKSNIFYFVALAISLTAYIGIFLNFIILQNNAKVQEINNNVKNINLTIIIITIPLFVLSIIQMVKSLKEEKQVSKKAIMFLMINLIIMFCLTSYSIISNYKYLYSSYTKNIESISDDTVRKQFTTIRTNLVFSTINSFIKPIVYLITSILAYIFKVKEDKEYINNTQIKE